MGANGRTGTGSLAGRTVRRRSLASRGDDPPDPIERADLDLEGLTWAVQANWEALAAHLADEHGGWFETLHGLVRFSTGLHSGFLNGVLSADVELEDLPGALALTRHVFGEELPWRWIVGPSSHPEGLELELETLGLERRWPRMLGMSIDLEATPSALDPARMPGRRAPIAEVEDRDALEAWLSVRQRNLGLDEETTDAWRIGARQARPRPGQAAPSLGRLPRGRAGRRRDAVPRRGHGRHLPRRHRRTGARQGIRGRHHVRRAAGGA